MSINTTLENKFNLVEEPWITAAGRGRISLRQAFEDREITALGGNPIQKLAVTKLLLAIAQAAHTPVDNAALDVLGADEFREKCLDYLDRWKDLFWLYGARPFLQMPAIEGLVEKRRQEELKKATTKSAQRNAEDNAKPKPIGLGYYPDMPAENNTVLTQYQFERELDDADKALFVLTLMNFALGGKRIEKDLDPLSSDYSGKTISAKSAPSLGSWVGYLHSHLVGPTLIDSVMLNLLSHEHISRNAYWITGLGTPVWEQMPSGESCAVAEALKKSYMATLLSLSRFVLLKADGIYYVEGIQYPSHKNGWREPGMAIESSELTPKVIWADPNRRPWRELSSMLSFIVHAHKYDCQFIEYGLDRGRARHKTIGVWSGGLKVTSKAGDQSVKQDDDFIESLFFFDSAMIGEFWYNRFKHEMIALEQLSKAVYASTQGYFKVQMMDGGMIASKASGLFWQLCERNFQELIIACEEEDKLPRIRALIAQNAMKSFETYCPKDTSRQLEAWAKCKPNLLNYLNPNA
jgi:CRISPR system Cascade subunit CasA